MTGKSSLLLAALGLLVAASFPAWPVFLGGDAKKPVVTDAATQCFACHTPRKDHDYVYSTYIP